jgi:hypothetical protein
MARSHFSVPREIVARTVLVWRVHAGLRLPNGCDQDSGKVYLDLIDYYIRKI